MGWPQRDIQMRTPIPPERCNRTGRVLTEWFETPEFSVEDLKAQAEALYGPAPNLQGKSAVDFTPDETATIMKINNYVTNKRNRKWVGAMSQQEVSFRMNEATKMVSPDNFKFLDNDVRQRTGLELNPLWMMECLYRSGILNPKDQITVLKELANYTHSKAPSINHSTVAAISPEDWLLELAKGEYEVLGKEVPMPEPRQPVEKGSSGKYLGQKRRREKDRALLAPLANEGWKELEAELEAYEDDT